MTDAALNESWADEARQRLATQFGLWAFLATETLFFGGLFLFYAVARWSQTARFSDGARHADVVFGTANTVVLLTSSLTMARRSACGEADGGGRDGALLAPDRRGVGVSVPAPVPGRTMTREERRRVILAPLAVWAALMALLAMTVSYALWPHAPLKTEAGLAVALGKGLLIAVLFMQLKTAAGLVRIAAIAGVSWASFLYILTFADLLTR